MKNNWIVNWDEKAGAAGNAREKLPQLAEEYITRGSAIATEDAAPEQLHQLRLATKHFRYTLEIFRPIYGEALESWLAELKQVQQYLGEINDYRMVRQRFEADLGAARFLEFLDARFAARRAEFLEYWRLHFGTPDRLDRWRKFLGPEQEPALASGGGGQRSHGEPKAG